jgi:hypothetical protein
MPCPGDGCNCELPRDFKRCRRKMLNNRGGPTAPQPRLERAPRSYPAITSRLMAANAGSVTGSFAALEATG